MEEFKNNSNASKEERLPGPSKVTPITTNVKVKNNQNDKKPFRKFFAEDAKKVGSHVVESVVVPSLQKLLSDAVKGAVDWLIYGSRGPRGYSTQSTGIGTVSYSSLYRQPTGINGPYQPVGVPQGQPMQRPGTLSVNEITFYDRGEAEKVLQCLCESLERYGTVAVADFYDLVGQRCSYTDQKYGWYDLRPAQIIRAYDGYVIQFPKIQPIE